MAALHWTIGLSLVALCSALTSYQGSDLVFSPDVSATDRSVALRTDADGFSGSDFGGERFSICLYAFLENTDKDTVTLFNYSFPDTPSTEQVSLEINYARHVTNFYILNEAIVFGGTPPLNEWTHICVAWDNGPGIVYLYVDGELRGRGAELSRHDVVGKDGVLFLGGNQASNKNLEVVPAEGVDGRLTQFNLWNVFISEEQVKLAKDCKLEGNVLNWRNSNWTLFGNVKVEPTKAPCSGVPKELTLENLKNEFLNTRDLFVRQMEASQQKIFELERNSVAAKNEIESLNEKLASGVDELQTLRNVAYEEVSMLKKRFDGAEQLLNSLKQAAEKEISSLTEKAGHAIGKLTQRFDLAEKDLNTFKMQAQHEITSLKEAAGREINSLNNRFDAAVNEFNAFKKTGEQEIVSLKKEGKKLTSALQQMSKCCVPN